MASSLPGSPIGPVGPSNPAAARLSNATRALEDAVRMLCYARSPARRGVYLNLTRECMTVLTQRLREAGVGDVEIAAQLRRAAERTAPRHDGAVCVPALHALIDDVLAAT